MKQAATIRLVFLFCFIGVKSIIEAQQLVSDEFIANSFLLDKAAIYSDDNDYALVKKSAELLQQDIEMVTGKKLSVINDTGDAKGNIIIIGSVGKSSLIQKLIQQKKINAETIKDKWEAFQIQTIGNPMKGVDAALVITGSDRRGVAYGVFELSKQLGVSPWYWWADVPVTKGLPCIL